MNPAEPDVPSNWGRWGSDDQLGTLNFITSAARARGAAEVRTGRVVSLAFPVTPVPLSGPIPFGTSGTPAAILQSINFTGTPPRALTDLLVINTHHVMLTHIDALAHIPLGDRVYPGVNINEATAGGTIKHGSTSVLVGGIATRGVLLDLAPGGQLPEGHAVTDSDLDNAELQMGVHVESGDALVLRGGWAQRYGIQAAVPHLSLDAVRWIARREIALYAGDIGDPPLTAGASMWMHGTALPRLGLPLIDNPDVSALAQTCAELGRDTFFFVLGALPVVGATGVPVNPLAIF